MPQSSLQARMSFSESRDAILKTMTATAKAGVEEKVIRFQNDDVPRFLEILDEYEIESKQTRLVCK